MLLIGVIRCTGYVCQYGVFILKHILSYLPVHLICSPPSSPLSPTIAVDLRIEGLVCVGPELPGGRCQTYVTGSKGVSHWEWEKCLMSVSGRLSVGLIRCTGKYDNISFRIKTPFLPVFL